MLGFSLQKLLVLIAVIGAVLAGFRYAKRIKAFQERQAKVRAARAAEAKRAQQSAAAASQPARATAPVRAPAAVEEMQACRVCGAYVAAGSEACGRTDCPLA